MFAYVDAAKKYHEYLVRQEKPLSEEEKGLLAKSDYSEKTKGMNIHIIAFAKIYMDYIHIVI